MANAVMPELSVWDWRKSLRFYCDLLVFNIDHQRPEDGFAYLSLGLADLTIDQIGVGRDFDNGHLPDAYPFGRGINLQIKVANVTIIDGMSPCIWRATRAPDGRTMVSRK